MGTELIDLLRENDPNLGDTKIRIFLLWYNLDRPTALQLYEMLDDPKPSKKSLQDMVLEFPSMAKALDKDAAKALGRKITSDKVLMLRKHQRDAQELQSVALTNLTDPKLILKPNDAIRLWKYAVDIEKASAGLEAIYAKIETMSDDQLLEELQKLAETNTLGLLPDGK